MGEHDWNDLLGAKARVILHALRDGVEIGGSGILEGYQEILRKEPGWYSHGGIGSWPVACELLSLLQQAAPLMASRHSSEAQDATGRHSSFQKRVVASVGKIRKTAEENPARKLPTSQLAA